MSCVLIDESNIESLHKPVLPEAVLNALAPLPGGRYLDGTLGMGGHAAAILGRAPDCELCGLDQDEVALKLARQRLSAFAARVNFFHLRFGEFYRALDELGWDEIDGALLDLGISSLQLDDAARGFSYRADGRLDMRMDQNSGRKSAWHLVNYGSFEELRDCIATLGEEPQAGRIARQIIQARQKEQIDGTQRLAEIVCSAYPASWRWKSRRHPAVRTFQALRMAVNDELGQLQEFLRRIMDRLKHGGRLVIITFHSLEDRMVKHAMRDWAKDCICPPCMGICTCGHKAEARILYKKPVIADEAELKANPRAASAKLRAAEKL